MKRITLRDIHNRHVEKTVKEAVVTDQTIHICNLTFAVMRALAYKSQKVYINTRALKHLYDKKTAEEYHFIVDNLHTIIKYPDHIYRDKPSKRGDYCLIKRLGNNNYMCSIEMVEDSEPGYNSIFAITAFRVQDSYLNNYELMWNWRDGDPSS